MEARVLRGQEEIAAYLGISVQTFWRKRDELRIPYYRVGSRVCARADALDDWIKAQGKERLHDQGIQSTDHAVRP